MRQNLPHQLFNASANLVLSSIVASGLVVFARPVFLPAFGAEISNLNTENINSEPIEAIAPWLLPPPNQSISANLNITPADQYQASLLRQQGLADRQVGLFDQAIANLEQSTQLDPTNINGHVLLGWTQHLAGDHDNAARSLWQAIQRDPRSVEAFNALGIVYLVRGDLNHAVLSHSWAAMLKPDNEIAYYNLSLAYQRQQVYDWAIAYGKAAASLEPYNPHPFVALAVCYWSQGDQGDRDRAIEAYRQALIIDARYGDPGFLNYLDEAGFSAEQIQLAKAILSAT
ncbi:Tetratricopeptide TPR_1 repeat-containing protein [Thalassoporum mexicanum PCC 7367]|uniref:tetratricopeptide repeat protein n=1 Tax=Thalassoporum mexicanum TaxID=3457544 RepID=UPI00029F92B9|nr:tetratricopeptide repeat protein [Pseudanabaena sp. PCC 7367]AFY71094.1 Tetratricopeptide TPR_1 repeat-containing protein [Pseudanabaena sp. PCC 7367]